LSARRFCSDTPSRKLHQDIGRALGCHASVEDFDDVCDDGWRWQPGFVEKTPDQLGILGQRLVQDLDGGATFNERVLGKVDLPEAPSPSSRTMR